MYTMINCLLVLKSSFDMKSSLAMLMPSPTMRIGLSVSTTFNAVPNGPISVMCVPVSSDIRFVPLPVTSYVNENACSVTSLIDTGRCNMKSSFGNVTLKNIPGSNVSECRLFKVIS